MHKTYLGTCHCGSVKFTVDTDLGSPIRCNCSLCIRKGAIMLSGKEGRFELVKGEKHLGKYQFNTHTAEHYLCKNCGIYTHHKPRTNPKIYRVNAGCILGLESLNLQPGLNDGASFS
ncbi:MAG: hypothetical protein ACJA13_001507 [Paraglaciecola sp.]|jgi:hypothetical protein